LRKTVINLGFLIWAYRRKRREMLQQYVGTLETRRQKEILQLLRRSVALEAG
jgi:hypothetical protein